MTDKEMIEEMARLIKLPIENWLEDTGAIPKATTYYAELMGCINDSAEVLFNEGYRKIPEGSVMVSKQIWEEHIEKREKANKIFEERTRKETAREILSKGKDFYNMSYHKSNAFPRLAEWITERFGLEVKE